MKRHHGYGYIVLLCHAFLGMSKHTLHRASLPSRCKDGLYQLATIGEDATQKAARGAVCGTTAGKAKPNVPHEDLLK